MVVGMTAFFDFAIANPFLGFILICAVYYTLKWIITTPFRMFNRWCRRKNIAEHGWPPEHLDADGDFKPSD